MARWFWTKVRRDDPRYPRRGGVRAMRTALVLAWSLIGIYASAVTINLIGLIGRGLSHLANRSELVHALLFPDFLADPSVPLAAFVPFILALALLVTSGLWAVRDLAIERAILRARDAQQRKLPGGERPEAYDPDVPSLYIIPIDGGESPRLEPVLQDEVTVGRDTTNTIVLADKRVSRKQMRIARELYYWRVTCRRNTAKLYVNGTEQTDAILRPHDQLVVGTTILRFVAPLPATTTAMAEQMPQLVVSYANVSFTAALRDAKVTLGRAPDCGIVVPSKIVSRYHAELLRTSEATYEIQNTGGRNALQFQGKPVPRHTFRHGDTITLGAGSGLDVVLLRYLEPDGPVAMVDVEAETEIGGVSSIFQHVRVDERDI